MAGRTFRLLVSRGWLFPIWEGRLSRKEAATRVSKEGATLGEITPFAGLWSARTKHAFFYINAALKREQLQD